MFDCSTRYRCLYSSQHSHLAVESSGLESGRECDAPRLPVLAAGGAALGADRRREGAIDRDLGDHSLAGGTVVWRHPEDRA